MVASRPCLSFTDGPRWLAWLLMEVKHAGIALGCLVLWFGLAGLLRAETPRVAALPSVRPETGADEGAPKTGQQIRLDVKIGELSVTEMRRLGIDFSEIRNGQTQQDHEETAGVVAMLTRNNVFKIVAEPSLVAAEGRPVFFHSGPTVAGRKIGSQVQLTAKLLDNHRVKIDLHTIQTDEEPLLAVALRGGIAPAFRTSEMVKSFEMDLGKTMISAGMVQTQPATDAPGAHEWAGPNADARFRHAAVGRAGGVIKRNHCSTAMSRNGTCNSRPSRTTVMMTSSPG